MCSKSSKRSLLFLSFPIILAQRYSYLYMQALTLHAGSNPTCRPRSAPLAGSLH
jgi:hypothetical protein